MISAAKYSGAHKVPIVITKSKEAKSGGNFRSCSHCQRASRTRKVPKMKVVIKAISLLEKAKAKPPANR